MKVGLSGYCVPTGLGYENRRMWKKLPIDRWLVWPHPKMEPPCEGYEQLSRQQGLTVYDGKEDTIDRFLDGLDVVLCTERTFPDDLFERAHRLGPIHTVLLVNPEWFDPIKKQKIEHIDTLVARNQFCYDWLTSTGRCGDANVVYLPCPIDLDEWPYRQRQKATMFFFSNGWGGVHDRKGWTQVRDVLTKDPTLIQVQSQKPLPDAPPGVQVLSGTETTQGMYDRADVAVQPSHWEGVGLAILEAMASGVPVMTTDAAPMNEYIRAAHGEDAELLLLPVGEVEEVELWYAWQAHRPDPEEMQKRIVALRGKAIAGVSMEAREYIERVHGESCWAKLWQTIQGDI